MKMVPMNLIISSMLNYFR